MDLIDGVYVNAGNVNLYCKITGQGAPTILIEPGIGCLSVEWTHVQRELSKYTTVVTYDRAGYGESPRAKTTRNCKNIVNELFNLLFNSNLAPPYIFIGHSEGALFVQHFAKLFPNYTAGLILLDPLFPDYWELESIKFPTYLQIASYSTRIKNLKKISDLEDNDFSKKIIPLLQKLYQDFPDEFKIPLITYQSEKKFFETVLSEFEMLETNLYELYNNGKLGDFPVIIASHSPSVMQSLSVQLGISNEEAEIIENFWLEETKKLVSFYPQAMFYVIDNSDKNFHFSNPTALINIALEMLDDVKQKA
ncbi:MAG: alpha/beta fold hydrolase [Candidatus Kapaibacteriales bacterium]